MDSKSENKILSKYNKLPKEARASFWFLICMILQKGISILTTPIFTRLLGPELYGEFGLFTSWESIISVFVTLRLTAGVYTQGLVKFHDRRDEFSVSMQGLSSFIIFCFGIIYAIFSSFFNDLLGLNTYQMISMFIIMWTGEIFSFWLCEQRVDYKYRMLVIWSLLASLAKPIAGIFAVLNFDDKVTARIISMAIINLIFYLPFLLSKIKKHLPFYSKKFWKYALIFNLPLVPHYLSQTVLSKADVIMIQKMIGLNKAGIYNLSYQLSLILLIVNTALIQTMTPWMYRKMRDRKIIDIKGIAYISLIGISLLNLLLMLFAPEIVKIFAPKEFFEAIWIIPPIAMSSVFIFSYDLFSSFEFYFEKTYFVMIASVIGALANIGLNYIFINIFGYMAAGYTTLICYMLYAFGHYLFMSKICKDNFEDDEKPYNPITLLLIYLIFIASGFIIMATYKYIFIRITIMALSIILLIVFRKKILENINKVLKIKKENLN